MDFRTFTVFVDFNIIWLKSVDTCIITYCEENDGSAALKTMDVGREEAAIRPNPCYYVNIPGLTVNVAKAEPNKNTFIIKQIIWSLLITG